MFISAAAASRKTHTARQLWEEFYYFFVNWSCRFRENLFAFAAIWALNLASPSVAFGVTGAPGQRAHVHRLFLLLLLRAVRPLRSVRIVLLTPVDAFVLCSSQFLEAPIQDPEEERRRPATHHRSCRLDAAGQDERQAARCPRGRPAKRQNANQGLPESGAALVFFHFSFVIHYVSRSVAG